MHRVRLPLNRCYFLHFCCYQHDEPKIWHAESNRTPSKTRLTWHITWLNNSRDWTSHNRMKEKLTKSADIKISNPAWYTPNFHIFSFFDKIAEIRARNSVRLIAVVKTEPKFEKGPPLYWWCMCKKYTELDWNRKHHNCARIVIVLQNTEFVVFVYRENRLRPKTLRSRSNRYFLVKHRILCSATPQFLSTRTHLLRGFYRSNGVATRKQMYYYQPAVKSWFMHMRYCVKVHKLGGTASIEMHFSYTI